MKPRSIRFAIVGGVLVAGIAGASWAAAANDSGDSRTPVRVQAGPGDEFGRGSRPNNRVANLGGVSVGDVIATTEKVDGVCEQPSGGVHVRLELPPGKIGSATVTMTDDCKFVVTEITDGPADVKESDGNNGGLGGGKVVGHEVSN